jgi:hypothetical protein
MKLARRILMALGSIALAFVLVMSSPKAAHAVVAALVEVVNTAANPVIVSNINDPGRVPYLSELFGTTRANCSFGECLLNFPVVPSGHRLVVEHVSMILQANTGAVPAQVFITNSATYMQFFATVQDKSNTIVLDQPVLFYFDAGDEPQVGTSASVDTATAFPVNVTLAGYLLDCNSAPCSPIAH